MPDVPDPEFPLEELAALAALYVGGSSTVSVVIFSMEPASVCRTNLGAAKRWLEGPAAAAFRAAADDPSVVPCDGLRAVCPIRGGLLPTPDCPECVVGDIGTFSPPLWLLGGGKTNGWASKSIGGK